MTPNVSTCIHSHCHQSILTSRALIPLDLYVVVTPLSLWMAHHDLQNFLLPTTWLNWGAETCCHCARVEYSSAHTGWDHSSKFPVVYKSLNTTFLFLFWHNLKLVSVWYLFDFYYLPHLFFFPLLMSSSEVVFAIYICNILKWYIVV